jgi:hypothetical protein
MAVPRWHKNNAAFTTNTSMTGCQEICSVPLGSLAKFVVTSAVKFGHSSLQGGKFLLLGLQRDSVRRGVFKYEVAG